MVPESAPIAFEVVTKSDAHFFAGLRALLNSLAVFVPEAPVTVLDCGMTDDQVSLCRRLGVRLQRVNLSQYRIERAADQGKFTPAIYALLEAELGDCAVTVHVDADAVVLGPLTELVQAAARSGLAAVPDHPALDLKRQIGEEGALREVLSLLPALRLSSVAFNAGVVALRRGYFADALRPIVQRLLPLHTRLWGNDQALLNLAAFQANPKHPFEDAGTRFNARPRYSRAPEEEPLRKVDGRAGPGLIGFGGTVRILHFVGRPKPWEDHYPRDDPAWQVWNHYYELAEA